MLRFSIVQDDMLIRDERALQLLRSKINPQTRRSEYNGQMLADVLRCHRNTSQRILHRLAGLGFIKLHKTRGQNGFEIEVLNVADD